jgi:hypothetical protein
LISRGDDSVFNELFKESPSPELAETVLLDEADDDDDEEALKIATARAKHLRMMQLHASSSPSRSSTVSARSGLGESLNSSLNTESSARDNQIQNRTSTFSQADGKHLKSLEASRSKFLRMKQQQRSKKQHMQLNKTPKSDLWKDTFTNRDRKINDGNK